MSVCATYGYGSQTHTHFNKAAQIVRTPADPAKLLSINWNRIHAFKSTLFAGYQVMTTATSESHSPVFISTDQNVLFGKCTCWLVLNAEYWPEQETQSDWSQSNTLGFHPSGQMTHFNIWVFFSIFKLSSRRRDQSMYHRQDTKQAGRLKDKRMPTFPLAVPPATPMINGPRFALPSLARSPGFVSLSASMLHLRRDAALWHTAGPRSSHLTLLLMPMMLMKG